MSSHVPWARWVPFALVLAVGAAATATRAEAGDFRLAASLQLESRYARAMDHPSLAHLGDGGMTVRAMGGPWRAILYGAGIGYRIGAAGPAGFSYEVELLPIGAGWRLGHAGHAGVFFGGGIGGVTGREPFAWRIPLEAHVEVTAHPRIRLLARARTVWVHADARRQGSVLAPVGDELEASLALRVGRRYREGNDVAGNGYFFGALYGERMGGRFAGLIIGYSIDTGFDDS